MTALTRLEKLQFVKDWMWNPDEDSVDQFERIGKMFYKETGYMRPGKSYPMDCFVPDNLDEMFRNWCLVQNRLCHEMLESLIQEESK